MTINRHTIRTVWWCWIQQANGLETGNKRAEHYSWPKQCIVGGWKMPFEKNNRELSVRHEHEREPCTSTSHSSYKWQHTKTHTEWELRSINLFCIIKFGAFNHCIMMNWWIILEKCLFFVQNLICASGEWRIGGKNLEFNGTSISSFLDGFVLPVYLFTAVYIHWVVDHIHHSVFLLALSFGCLWLAGLTTNTHTHTQPD